ncbi:hypothetical protein CRYUN_Cryun35bG0036800 [Craigia yunnanensis]
MANWYQYLPIFLALYVFTKHFLNRIHNLPPSPFPCLPINGHLCLQKIPLYKTLSKIANRNGPILFFKSGHMPSLLSHHHLLQKNASPRTTSFSPIALACSLQNTWLTTTPDSLGLLTVITGETSDELHQYSFCQLTACNCCQAYAWMRKRYYGYENMEVMELARMFREIQIEALELSSATNLGDFLPWLKSRKLERRKKTMIEILLSLQEPESEYYTDEIIRGLMIILLMAGTETSINTMEWALSLLLNNPEALKKARTEIVNTVGHERLIDESDLAQLPYLRSIISETLRLYPPVPMLVPHESSEECMVEGFRVPSGTMLLFKIWDIQNDPKIWEDPTRFKPERFEGPEGARDGFKSMPFGTGRRGCPGEGLGLRIVGLTLGALIQCF